MNLSSNSASVGTISYIKSLERRAAPGFSTHMAVGEFGLAKVLDFHNPPPPGHLAGTRRGFSRLS